MGSPRPDLEPFRVGALQSLAEAIAQINKFNRNQDKMLEFDPTGKLIGLRGVKVVDAVAMYPMPWRLGCTKLGRTSNIALFYNRITLSNYHYDKTFGYKLLDLLKKNNCIARFFILGVVVIKS